MRQQVHNGWPWWFPWLYVAIMILAIILMMGQCGCQTVGKALKLGSEQMVIELAEEAAETVVERRIGDLVVQSTPWAATVLATVLAGKLGWDKRRLINGVKQKNA